MGQRMFRLEELDSSHFASERQAKSYRGCLEATAVALGDSGIIVEFFRRADALTMPDSPSHLRMSMERRSTSTNGVQVVRPGRRIKRIM